MSETFATIFVNITLQFITLLITGRIFTYFSSNINATWIEDIQASGLICIIMFVLSLITLVIPGFSLAIPLIYILLIYIAFQMNGFYDILFFFVVHQTIKFIFMSIGVSVLLSTPFQSVEESSDVDEEFDNTVRIESPFYNASIKYEQELI